MTFILILILAVIIWGSYYSYHIAFYSPIHSRPTSDEPLKGPQYEAVSDHLKRISSIMQRYSFERFTVKSFDGIQLVGRYYHFKDNAPIQILFHGYRSHPYRDCCGGHSLARKMGFNVLVVDQRGHGESGSRTITFGIKERKDCQSWIDFVNMHFGSDTPIILSGLSMGAATVLMASDLPLPHNVSCIIADSPYSSPAAIIEKVCADKHYPVAICRPFIYLGALLFGKFRLSVSTAKDAVRNTHIPILLIHGESDDFVPCNMSLEIAANCASRVEVVTFPGAGHGLSYISDPIRYEQSVCRFLLSIPALQNTIDNIYIAKLNDNN